MGFTPFVIHRELDALQVDQVLLEGPGLFCKKLLDFANYGCAYFTVGDPELDVTSEPYDVLLANPDGGDFDSDEG